MIRATKYEVEDLGKYFKTSKKKYKWYFQLDGKDHVLELEFSYLSGKRKLLLDGRPLHESMMLTSSFQYPFTLEGFALNVIQQGDTFELRINNKVFSHLYTQQKTQSEFVFEEGTTQSSESGWGQTKTNPSDFSEFGSFSQQNTNKFSLNIKLDKKEDQKGSSPAFNKKQAQQLPQPNQGGIFGNPRFEDFESFGQFGAKPNQQQNKNPFGDFGDFSQFGGQSTTQSTQKPQTAKVDLLDLDEPQQPVPEASTQQQAPQSANLFDVFGGTGGTTTQQPQQQPQQQNQSTNLFDAFAQQPTQQTQQPQVQPLQAPNILNLYGSSPTQLPVNYNMAYNNFPAVLQQQSMIPPQGSPPLMFPPQDPLFQQPGFQAQGGFPQQYSQPFPPQTGYPPQYPNMQQPYQQPTQPPMAANTPFDIFK